MWIISLENIFLSGRNIVFPKFSGKLLEVPGGNRDSDHAGLSDYAGGGPLPRLLAGHDGAGAGKDRLHLKIADASGKRMWAHCPLRTVRLIIMLSLVAFMRSNKEAAYQGDNRC